MFGILIELLIMNEEGIAMEEIMQYGLEYIKRKSIERIKNNVIPFRRDIKLIKKDYKTFKEKGAKGLAKQKLTPKWLKKFHKLLDDLVNPDVEKELTKREVWEQHFDAVLPWYLKPYKKNFINVALYIDQKEMFEHKEAFRVAKKTMKERVQQENDYLSRLGKEEQQNKIQREKDLKNLQKQLEILEKNKEKAKQEMYSLIESIFDDSSIEVTKKVEIYQDFADRNNDFKEMLRNFIDDLLTMQWVKPTKKIRAIRIKGRMCGIGFRDVCIFIVKSPETGNFSVMPLKYFIENEILSITIRGYKSRIYPPYLYSFPLDILEKAMTTKDYGKDFFWKYTPPMKTKNMPKYKKRYEKNIGKYSV